MPVFEETTITDTLLEWWAVLDKNVEDFTLCVIDDGSRDRTPGVLDTFAAQHAHVQVIHKSNSGHGQSCLAGYRLALTENADWIFQIDSDGQCDPRYFPHFWSLRSSYPVIFGLRSKREDGWQRALISRITAAVVFLVSGTWVRDANVPYRLMKAEALSPVLPKIPAYFYLANIPVSIHLARRPGIRWEEIVFHERKGGEASVKTWAFATRGYQLAKQLYASGIRDGDKG